MLRRLSAEALGTFMVTAAAVGVDVFYFTRGDIDYVSRWLARGLVTSVAIYAFAETSGAHVDPIVTLAFLMRRAFSWRLSLLYICVQFGGAFVASAMWWLVVGRAALAFGASHPGPQFGSAAALGSEVVCSFVLILTILMTAQHEAEVGKQAALAVGFIVAVCGIVAGPISGASMNPARTIAPQVLAGATSSLWIYVAGPIVGAALAVAVHRLLYAAPSRGLRRAARGRHPIER